MEKIVLPAEQLATEAAKRFEAMVRGEFHVAVPGGSVATLLFPAFARADVDWPAVHVWWVDERRVPVEDPDSNFRVAKELWLSKVAADSHYFSDESCCPERLDLAILGVGPDGHVASLFPGHPALEEKKRCALAIED